MPVYEVQGPDGRTFEIEGAAIPTPDQLRGIFSRLALPPTPTAPAKRAPSPFSGIDPAGAVVDVGKGALAGLLSTAYHGGDLIRRGLGMRRVIDTPEARAAMTPPESIAGKVGFYGEQIGEFAAPAAMVSRAVKGARLLPRMAAEGAAGAGVTAVQSGGDAGAMTVGGVIGAAIPPVGAALRPIGRAVQRAAAGAKEGGLGGAMAAAVRTTAPVGPKALIVQAIKPRATNTRFIESLDRSMPELKQAEAALGRPIGGIDDLLAATKLAKRSVRAQFDQMAGPAKQMGSTVDLTPVARAVQASIPKRTMLQSPQVAERLAQKMDVYKQRFPIEDAEQLLKEVNAELDGFYAKYPGAQRRALASDPAVAALEAEATTLRTVIYSALDHPGQGAAAREINRRYGSLIRLEEEAQRRANVAKRQQPESLSEQIAAAGGAADRAAGVFRIGRGIATGNPSEVISGGADMIRGQVRRETAKYLKEQQTTDALISRAFSAFKGTPGKIDMPPPVQIKGLLGRGPLVTPPPADTSGVSTSRAVVMDTDAAGRPIYSSDPNQIIDAQFTETAPVASPIDSPQVSAQTEGVYDATISGDVDQARRAVRGRIEDRRATGLNRRERDAHVTRVFDDILADARATDPGVDPGALRAEFDARLNFFNEIQAETVASGADPRTLLQEIARKGGVFERDNLKGQAGELRRLREGQRFGNIGGIPGVLSTKARRYDPLTKTRTGGLPLDVMLQDLQADGRFPWLESIDDLTDFLDDVQRNGLDEYDLLPGTEKARRQLGMTPGERWWESKLFDPDSFDPSDFDDATTRKPRK